jgi:hypothetical protein
MDIKKSIKKLLHRHKYTELRMYPPRPKYGDNHWGFLVACECGHVKLTKLPDEIDLVREMVSVNCLKQGE